MNKYKIKEVKTILEEIYELDRSMLLLYKDLINLELAGKKDSVEYKENTGYIQMIRELTEKKYQKLHEYSYMEITEITKIYLLEKDRFKFENNVLSQITEKDDESIVYNKMIHKFSDIISHLSLEDFFYSEDYNDEEYYKQRRELYTNNMIVKQLSSNIMLTLDKVISKTTNKETIKELTRYKYIFAYYSEDIFELAIKKNFTFQQEDINITDNLIKFNYSMPELFRNDKNKTCMNYINSQREVDIPDKLNEKEKAIKYLVKRILIKSGVDFIDNPRYLDKIKYEIIDAYELTKENEKTYQITNKNYS